MPAGSLLAAVISFLRRHSLAGLLRRLRRVASADQRRHPFDGIHHVDTSGLLYAQDLPSGHRNDLHNSGYYATAPSLLQGVIAHWKTTLPQRGPGLSEYTMLDIGSGKGRVLMLASEYPFRAIVGVELNPGLARRSRRNLKSWLRTPRASQEISILTDDVLSCPFPDGPVVIYFFNSFERELVKLLVDRLLELSATRSHPIDLLYVHPEHGEIFDHSPRIQLLADQEIVFTGEDATADVFGVGNDRCSFYRLDGQLPAVGRRS